MTPNDLVAEAIRGRYTRREIVKRAAALGFSVPIISVILAACGGDDDDDDNSTDTDPTATQGSSSEPTATSAESAATTADDPDPTEDEEDQEPTQEEEEDDAATPEDSGSAGGGAEPTGSIVISLMEEPATLENWNAFRTPAHPILRNVMEALLNRDPQTNELVPELALSWERTDDLTWRFTLREGVTFHNGEAFNAEVAAFGLNYTWDPENGFDILGFLGPEMTVTAVDEYTIDVTTTDPDPILPSRLYFSPIPSKTQLESDAESAKDHPIGTGPYTFVEWAKGQHVRLTANPDWWGNDATDAYGQVTIKDVELQFRQESTVRSAQISAGEAHATHWLNAEDCSTLSVCQSVSSIETYILRLDTMNPTMADIRIRQAIGYAIDVEAASEQIFVGSIPASQIYSSVVVGYNDDLEPYPFDMDLAKQLIEEAAADGVPVDAQLTVVSLPGDGSATEFIQYVAEQLNQVGLNVQSEVLESAQYRPEVYGTGRDDVSPDRGWIVLGKHGNELMDASASIVRYFACDPNTDSTYCNEELDPQIYEALTLEGEERDHALAEVAAAYYEEYPIIPVAHLNVNYGMVEELNWTPRLDGFMLLKEMSFASS